MLSDVMSIDFELIKCSVGLNVDCREYDMCQINKNVVKKYRQGAR